MRTLLPLLPKPSYYLGIEPGSVHKNPESVRLRIALAFPDKYEIGMSYLGHKILYSIINTTPAWQAERVFAPEPEAAAVLRAHNAPLCTMESDTPLAQVDMLGFSITHELCYTNILYMLDLAGIPARGSDRDRHPEKYPLVIAGGGCTMAAEPMAPFIDLMLLGDGEESLPALLRLYDAWPKTASGRPQDKDAFIRQATAIPGVYAPGLYEPMPGAAPGAGGLTPRVDGLPRPSRHVVADMDNAPYPAVQVMPFGAIHNRLALEIGRGCTRGCRFCQAGMTGRPARERSVNALSNLLDSCLAGTGYGELSFLSLSSGDFSALKTLFTRCVDRCVAEEISVSLPSLRVGSIDDSIMERMAGIRRTGATLAPEAGSQRLRDVINKGVTEEDLILHVQKLFEHGWQQVKLYFMIGLPTETDDDILAIIDLARKVRDAAGPGIKRLQVTVAVSPFVPKPYTPFQWEAQASMEEIKRRIGLLLGALKKEKRITMRWHEPEVSFLEGIFSRGDRALAPVVERAYAKGAIFASWMEHFSLQPWLDAMHEEGLDPAAYCAARDIHAPLPWGHLENGTSTAFLLRERENAFAGKTCGDCRYEHCHACGVCDLPAAPSQLHPVAPLAPLAGGAQQYANRLNLPQRDQAAHKPRIDEYGRVCVREQDSKKTENAGKGLPPAIAEHLTRKAVHLRIEYEKKDRAAYLSQLELQSVFEQAFRKRKLPLTFSRGYHPLPLLSFCRAMPVGVASEAEWLAVFLREPRSAADVAASLGQILPGLNVTEVTMLLAAERCRDAMGERYTIQFLGRAELLPEFTLCWNDFSACATLPWTRETKKGIRSLDARSYVTQVSMPEDGVVQLDCSWEQGYISPLALVTAIHNGLGCPLSLTDFQLTKRKRTI